MEGMNGRFPSGNAHLTALQDTTRYYLQVSSGDNFVVASYALSLSTTVVYGLVRFRWMYFLLVFLSFYHMGSYLKVSKKVVSLIQGCIVKLYMCLYYKIIM